MDIIDENIRVTSLSTNIRIAVVDIIDENVRVTSLYSLFQNCCGAYNR